MLQAHPDATDRQVRILDAAERCFVRAGFHRTTMQDIAAEAGMSAGNLYRYFSSKDAMVVGLTERDRRESAESFAGIRSAGDDFVEAFSALGRRHFEEEPREKAILCLEIWAEATRNAAFGKLVADFSGFIVDHLTQVIDEAKAAGSIRPAMESRAIATVICTIGDGLLVRRATLDGFDAPREIEAAMHVVAAMMSGAVPSLPVRAVVEPVP